MDQKKQQISRPHISYQGDDLKLQGTLDDDEPKEITLDGSFEREIVIAGIFTTTVNLAGSNGLKEDVLPNGK
jgi:hypothetical protein